MATSTIPMSGWTKAVLATGITQYTNRKERMCALVFNGYSVLGSGIEGNAGNILETLPEDVLCAVQCVGYGSATIKVSANGTLSLMNTSLGAYIAGTVYGVAIFLIN